MNANEIAIAVIDVLDRLRIPYMLVGSFSSNLWGIPRSTKDADFVVELGDTSVGTIATALGGAYRLDPQMSFESVTGTMRYQLHHPLSAFQVELFLLSADPHDRARFERRIVKPLEGRSVYVATAEDVIIMKLRWVGRAKRSKDIEDVKDVLDVQTSSSLDLTYIRHWCDQHGTRELFEELLAGAQP